MGLANGPVIERGYHPLESAIREAKDSYAQTLLAGPDTFAAEDAFIGIVSELRAARVNGEPAFDFPEPLCLKFNMEVSGGSL